MIPKRFRLIACEVLYREVCLAAAHSKNVIDIEFHSQGLHDIESVEMCSKLQQIVDRTDPQKYSAVLLGYGLCNNGLVGLKARDIKMVVPRAHDCITLFMGSKQRYLEYFKANPGTYYKTSGWFERDQVNMDSMPTTKMGRLGLDKSYQEYVEKYGEENARYILETLGDGLANYSKYAYIGFEFANHLGYDKKTRQEAAEKNFKYDHIKGELRLIQMLVDGDWPDEEFLVLNPGQKIAATYSDDIIRAENA